MKRTMKIKFLLVAVYLLTSSIAFAELSAISTQRIKQGITRCEENNNELIYKKYWRDSIKPENLNSVCMAEQFADQVANDSDPWLESNASGLIELCQTQSSDQNSYFSCLKASLDRTATEIANPCIELGAEKLWDEDKCRRLVSYIFMVKFEAILKVSKPKAEVAQVPADIVNIAEAELSLTSTWRIEQAIERCDQSNNELAYKEYWQDSVKPENKKTVCMAEQFADQVAADGDSWLEESSINLIEQCEKQGRKNREIYHLCLQLNLENKTKILSKPCKELGEKNLWSEQKCERLVSYIFLKKFEKIVESNRPWYERFMHAFDRTNEMMLARLLINPVAAIVLFILFALDVILFVDRGAWTRIMNTSFYIGPLILISCFAKGGIRIFSSGIVIVIIIMLIAWNHRKTFMKLDKEKPKPIEF